jgi:hypothetical protein
MREADRLTWWLAVRRLETLFARPEVGSVLESVDRKVKIVKVAANGARLVKVMQ